MGSSTHWKVRPYLLTAGRTRTRRTLDVHTLVSMPRYDAVFAGGLTREIRALYDRARSTCSVAELSASCGLPLGVTRVVIDDLAARDRLIIHSDARTPQGANIHLLERIRDGLLALA